MKKKHTIRFLVLAVSLIETLPLLGKTPESDWYQPLSPLTWQDVPLRSTLLNWCRAENVPLLIDCRVDPNTLITGTFPHASRITILQDVLQSASTEKKPLLLTQLDGVLYIGPARYASKLQTLSAQLHQKVRAFPASQQKIWLKKAPLRWENRATPREILQKLARENRLKFSQTRLIPHDLWVETQLPSLDLIDRLILVLGQMGLTFAIDEEKPNQIQLMQLDERTLLLEKIYPLSPSRQEKIATVREAFPNTQIHFSGKKIQVRGIAEVHTFLTSDEALCCVGAFRQGKSGNARASANVDRDLLRISGKVSRPFLSLVQQFCEQYGYELEFDANALLEAGISLEQRISMDVQDVTPDEFLYQLAEIAGCRIIIEKNRALLKSP